MKKTILLCLGIMIFSLGFAQLRTTKWTGALKGDNPRGAILDFKKDSLIVYSSSGTELIEAMTYKISGHVLTVIKVNGQSDCDNTTPGKYEFSIKGDKLVFKLSDDPCTDRSSALDTTVWTKANN